MRKDVIAIALSYVKTTYDSTKNIKFITDYYGRKKNARIAYCAMFVWDILRMAGHSNLYYGGAKTASCTTLLNFYKSKHPNWVHKDINRCKPGDLVFFQFDTDSKADHVGIFNLKKTSTTFSTIEGNTSNPAANSTNESNGGWVMSKTRKMSQVMAFVSPYYGEEDGICPFARPTTTVKKGTKGAPAGWAQWHINMQGFNCAVDQSFGPASVSAAIKFQKSRGLAADGSVGKATKDQLEIIK